MIKLSKQELEICYILSNVLNYYTSYLEVLDDVEWDSHWYKEDPLYTRRYVYLANKEECFALFRVKRKYKRVKNSILAIKTDFNQKDLDRLFLLTATYCLKHPYILDYFYQPDYEIGWEREEIIQGIAKINKIGFLHILYIKFKVRNHYKILCFIFGFRQYSFEEQKKIFKRDNSIHYILYIRIMFFMMFFAIIAPIVVVVLKMLFKMLL